MSQFASIKEVVSFAKSGAKLAAIAATVLQNNKAEGLNLLLEETLKAALAASLWNSPLKLLTVVDSIKSGKKTALTKQWLSATTELSRALPVNVSGDASRIPDESAFVSETNAAIVTWEKSWASFDEAQLLKKEQRAAKSAAATDTATPATAAPATAAPAATATAAAPAADTAADTAATLAELEALKADNQALLSANQVLRKERDFLEKENQALRLELAALKATQSPPSRKRVKATA